jgi:virulence factor Mce-like protein
MSRRPGASITASPVLIGSVTVLIAVIAVFIAYNANSGLPFLPTYKLRAELPNATKLVEGNEVRAGGYRVGIVKTIRAKRVTVHGKERSVAQIAMELDKSVQPLPKDTKLRVRPRSALGLKYVELEVGHSQQTFEPGDTMPLANSTKQPLDLEDVLASFPPQTRNDARASLQGFGSGIAGRGNDINVLIEELRPFLRHLTPVMKALNDPQTELAGFFPRIGRAAAEAAPVAEVQAELFTNMADTFAAISRDPAALQQTIEESPATLDASISSFRVQTPFLANFTDTSRLLQPGTAELRRSLPPVNSALRVGTPVLRRTPALAGDLEGTFRALVDLGEDPNTLLALRDLRTGVEVSTPAVQFVAPYQTLCNYLVYFFNPLGTHISQVVPGGTSERILAKLVSFTQRNTMANTQSTRPVDVPQGKDPQASPPEQALHTQYGAGINPYGSGGQADCQAGQTGYPDRLAFDSRYPPSPDPAQGGGSHIVVNSPTPGLSGGTYATRKLGIKSLKDVP